MIDPARTVFCGKCGAPAERAPTGAFVAFCVHCLAFRRETEVRSSRYVAEFDDCDCGEQHHVPIDETGFYRGPLPCLPGKTIEFQADPQAMATVRQKGTN